MAEYVADFKTATVGQVIPELRVLADRLGHGGQLRTKDRRDAEAAFAFFAASKDRFPVTRARFHVCRHDEGIADCSAALVED